MWENQPVASITRGSTIFSGDWQNRLSGPSNLPVLRRVLHATAVYALDTPPQNHSVEHILNAVSESTIYNGLESDWTIRGLSDEMIKVMKFLTDESISLYDATIVEVCDL